MSGAKEYEKELFDVVLIVELQEENGGKIVPFISYRYPQLFETDNFTSSVTQFCFPDINQFPTEEMNSEIFSFIVTDGSGERRFGYCLRKLPPGSGLRFPTAYSILSYFPCYSLYTTIIDKVAYHYENSSMKVLSTFLQSMLAHRFPAPGQSFTVKIEDAGQIKDFRFTRPDKADSLLEYVDVDPLLLQLNPTNILTIFLSLLFERRIIFCASKLSILSSCVQTAVAFLYPFTWQHIYIPVLPKTLLSFCCAPMPFVVGILASELNEVLTLPMDEVLIVNIDNDSFIRTPGTNDLNQLPSNYIEPLKNVVRASSKAITKYYKKSKEIKKLPKGEVDFQEKQLLYEVKKQKTELKETFLEFFVYLFGSLRKHIHNEKFDSTAFINSQPPEIRDFMELFVGSQMFEMFIQDRIHTKYNDDQFEKSVSHREKLNSEFTRFYGAEVDGSLYKPTNTKSKSKLKKSSVLDTLKKGIKTSLTSSTTMEGPISSPTLVQATNDRVTPTTPSPTPVPSSQLHSTPPSISMNYTAVSQPTFFPPNKAIPLPPKPSNLTTNINNNNNNNNNNANNVTNLPSNNNNNNPGSSSVLSAINKFNSNPTEMDQIVVRERFKPVRHHHSAAITNNLPHIDQYPVPPPRKLFNSNSFDCNRQLSSTLDKPLPKPAANPSPPQNPLAISHPPPSNQSSSNNHLSSLSPRGATRGRVKQRPMSSRPSNDELNDSLKDDLSNHLVTLRNSGSKNNSRPLPKPPI